jgi:voltage-gated potassium channel
VYQMSEDNSLHDSGRFPVPCGWLLISLFLNLIVVPLVEGLAIDRVVLCGGVSATIILATIVLWRRPVLRFPVLVLGTVAIPVAWAALFIRSTPLLVAHCLLGSAFFWLVGAVILVVVIRWPLASIDSVLGAISAYLLFGLAWAFTYWAMDIVSPESFKWPVESSAPTSEQNQIATFSRFIYYSMVTMSTLGYGDVRPVSNLARTLAWMQSVTGQFYVAVLVAWLVSALPNRNRAS